MFNLIKSNLLQLAIALDQVLNVLVCMALGHEAWADMTLSATSWIWYDTGVHTLPKTLIDKMFFWQDDHCYNAFLSECERQHSPIETRILT